MRRITVAAAVLMLSFAVIPASACPGVCMHEGREYSHGSVRRVGHDSMKSYFAKCTCIGETCNWVEFWKFRS